MHQDATSLPIPRPTPDQSRTAVVEARRMFHRALASWASDLLVLRSGGLDAPAWRGEGDEAAWRRAA